MQHTIFFAAAATQRKYFNEFCTVYSQASVIWYKSLAINPFRYRSNSNLSNFVTQELRKSENTRGKPYSAFIRAIYRLFLTIKAANLNAQYYRVLESKKPKTTVVWNGLKFRQQVWCLAAAELNVKIRYMENGLIPGYTTLDDTGVNYLNSVPRSGLFFKQYANRLGLTANTVTPKKNPSLPDKFIFIPFQVNGDSQVVCFSPWINNMSHLSNVLIELLPEFKALGYQVIVKPHPKCQTPRKQLEQSLKQAGVMILPDITSNELVNAADAVVTINSTVGLEALAAGKKLIVLGQAFYNLDSITLTANNKDELLKAIKTVDTWTPDYDAVAGLFEYLRNEYQLLGNWRDANKEHLERLHNRLEFMEGIN